MGKRAALGVGAVMAAVASGALVFVGDAPAALAEGAQPQTIDAGCHVQMITAATSYSQEVVALNCNQGLGDVLIRVQSPSMMAVVSTAFVANAWLAVTGTLKPEWGAHAYEPTVVRANR